MYHWEIGLDMPKNWYIAQIMYTIGLGLFSFGVGFFFGHVCVWKGQCSKKDDNQSVLQVQRGANNCTQTIVTSKTETGIWKETE